MNIHEIWSSFRQFYFNIRFNRHRSYFVICRTEEQKKKYLNKDIASENILV